MLIGDNCLVAMSFQHVRVVGSAEGLICSRKKFLQKGPRPVEGKEQ